MKIQSGEVPEFRKVENFKPVLITLSLRTTSRDLPDLPLERLGSLCNCPGVQRRNPNSPVYLDAFTGQKPSRQPSAGPQRKARPANQFDNPLDIHGPRENPFASLVPAPVASTWRYGYASGPQNTQKSAFPTRGRQPESSLLPSEDSTQMHRPLTLPGWNNGDQCYDFDHRFKNFHYLVLKLNISKTF